MKKISEKALKDMEKAGKQVLDDEELNLISGGQSSAMTEKGKLGRDDDYGKYDDLCWFSYCCHIAFLHPDDAEYYDACWMDHHEMCMFVNV